MYFGNKMTVFGEISRLGKIPCKIEGIKVCPVKFRQYKNHYWPKTEL